MKKHDNYFIAHLGQSVQDKYDLSDEQMEKLLLFLAKFDPPKVALRKALREKNRKSIESVMTDLFKIEQEAEYKTGPVGQPNLLSFPLSVPLTKDMIINK